MRVVVTGATGNVGTSVIDALAAEPKVTEIVGLARRLPELEAPKVRWAQADVASSELGPHFAGADVVVHLAWAIQPSHDETVMEETNVLGSRRVFDAAIEAGVGALVHASSVGVYGPGPKDRRVDESWSRAGISTSAYSRHKVEVERLLDELEAETPELRVVRMRPGLIFKKEAASEIRRLFAGPLLPNFLLRPRLIPIVPRTERLKFQAVHAADVGDAYRRAVIADVRGQFNLAAEPVIGPDELASLFKARPVPVSERVLRAAADLTWRAHLQPADAGWLDLALGVPLMDVTRAEKELGWKAKTPSLVALAELLNGMREADGAPTPPLDSKSGGPARIGEFLSGIGQRR